MSKMFVIIKYGCYTARLIDEGQILNVQWVTVGDVDVDIGANPSAEEGGDEEGVDSTSRKVVDVVDAFRLVVWTLLPHVASY